MEKIIPQKYYVYLENQEHGPFEVSELEQLVRDHVATHSTLARAVDSLQKLPLGDILNEAKSYESEAKRKKLFPRFLVFLSSIFLLLITMLFYGFYNRIKSVESYVKKHQDDQKAIFSAETQNTKNILDVEIKSIKNNIEILNENLIKNTNSLNQLKTSSINLNKEFNQRLSDFSKNTQEDFSKQEFEVQKITTDSNLKLSDLDKDLLLLDKKVTSLEKINSSFAQEIEAQKQDITKLKEQQNSFSIIQVKHTEWMNRIIEELKNIKGK
jgi:septal ring factor EnvC (AmiA/AmiB activator)